MTQEEQNYLGISIVVEKEFAIPFLRKLLRQNHKHETIITVTSSIIINNNF